MASKTSNEQLPEWINIPPTPPTTFPLYWFIAYSICTLILLPIHLCVCLIHLTYKLLMYIINKIFYFQSNILLTPIKPSSNSYVIITGAASGIGKDMTLLYAMKGFSIILIDINDEIKSYSESLKQKFKNQSFRYLIIDLSQSTSSETIYNTITHDCYNKIQRSKLRTSVRFRM